LEGLETGWVESHISGTYHFMPSPHTINDIHTARCGFQTIRHSDFYKKFEILDTSKICTKGEIIIKTTNQNQIKKKNFISNMKPIIPIQNTHSLKHVICSELKCKTSGVSFVSVNDEKDHYCIKHNLRVIQTIRKKEVVV